MTMKKKLLITIACLSVILCTMITGTIAWLTDKTTTVENKFTPSNIDVELAEAAFNGKMIPGTKIDKVATVTVTNDIACYVFVQVAESDNLDTFIAYTMADGWTELTEGSGIYYRTLATSENAQQFPVLKDNEVTVNSSVTKAHMDSLIEDNTKYPTLSFTAYACQQEGFNDAIAAWNEAKNAPVSPNN